MSSPGFRETPTPNTAQRVKALEKQLADVTKVGPAVYQKLSTDFNQMVQAIGQRLNAIDEVLAVLVEEIGAEEIDLRIEARRLKARLNEVENSKQAIADGVRNGFLTETPVVGTDSLIVGFESDNQGVPSNPPFSSLPFAQLPPHLKERFANAKVGDQVQTDEGTFTIESIFRIEKEKIESAVEKERAFRAAAEVPPEVAAEVATG
jgi:hypothetical protein